MLLQRCGWLSWRDSILQAARTMNPVQRSVRSSFFAFYTSQSCKNWPNLISSTDKWCEVDKYRVEKVRVYMLRRSIHHSGNISGMLIAHQVKDLILLSTQLPTFPQGSLLKYMTLILKCVLMIVLNFPRVSGPLCPPINPTERRVLGKVQQHLLEYEPHTPHGAYKITVSDTQQTPETLKYWSEPAPAM